MTKKAKKILFFLASLFLVVIGLFVMLPFYITSIKTRQDQIKTHLETLAPLELEYLTNFFKRLVFSGSFGYTIFADKPMSFEVIHMDMVIPSENIDEFDYMALEHILDGYRLREGLETWQKYAHCFPLDGYSIIPFSCPLVNCIRIAIINHHAFIKVVLANLSDFQFVLGKDLSAEKILEKCIAEDTTFLESIFNHDGLLGTLLGFGRGNAWEYMKMRNSDFNNLESVLHFFPEKPTDVIIFPPQFGVNPNIDETKDLRKKYAIHWEEVGKIYLDPNFLEIVLFKLCGLGGLKTNGAETYAKDFTSENISLRRSAFNVFLFAHAQISI